MCPDNPEEKKNVQLASKLKECKDTQTVTRCERWKGKDRGTGRIMYDQLSLAWTRSESLGSDEAMML